MPQDLIDALETRVENGTSDLPISTNLTDIVDKWFNDGGFPVVTVALNGSNIVLSQVGSTFIHIYLYNFNFVLLIKYYFTSYLMQQ